MKTKNVIIHVGNHKTASTYLQTHILPNFEDTTLLTRPFTQFNKAFNTLQYADDTLYKPQDIKEILENIDTKNVILSDENFSGKLFFYNAINRSMVAQRLSDLFPEATIVLVIRNQEEFVKSAYNHYVRGVYKGTKAIHKFIQFNSKPYHDFRLHAANAQVPNYPDYLFYNTDDTCLHLETLKYSKQIELYKSLFPNVHIFLYENYLTNIQRTVTLLEDILQSKAVISGNFVSKRENSSIDNNELYAQLKLNQSSSNNKYLKFIYKKYFHFKKGSSFELKDSFLKDYFQNDNKKVLKFLDDEQIKIFNKYYL